MKKAFLLLLSLILLIGLNGKAQQEYNLFIGTYTKPGKSEGIYVYRFNAANGEFEYKSLVKGIVNPSFLAVSKDNNFVYSITETPESGSVNAYRLDRSRPELILVNSVENKPGACHISVSKDYAFTASYGKGSISVFGIQQPGGELSQITQLIQHTGKSIDPKRQQTAHAHQIQFTPDQKYLVCTDLGEDNIYIYAYNPDAASSSNGQGDFGPGILKEHKVIKVTPGNGPRHLSFTPNGKFAYLANEFTGLIMAYKYKNGDLLKIQEIGTTDPGFAGNIDAADIHLSPDGKFLYESNRGEANTITVFSVAPDGRLTFVERVSTQGRGPRNFAIDPSGKYLLVGHQYTNDIVVFERNKKTGTLKDTGKRIEIGAPVCLVFAPVN
jgi:6-phosphogluconolactonase